MSHEIAALKVLFEYIGSTAMSQAIATYPYLTPKGRADKLPSMDESLVQTIFEHAMLVDDGDWRMMKAYGVVVWALATGMRSKELRPVTLTTSVSPEGNGLPWSSIRRVRGPMASPGPSTSTHRPSRSCAGTLMRGRGTWRTTAPM